ncbi:hypothetical protein [uncultured Mediterranean phage]|nr:hypothetical protein [uncultured Mediterranean phage]
MEVVKGAVQQISVKEARDGQYGKWANYGIKVNDSWFNGNLNADKHTGLLTLKDKNYHEIKEGMEVEFLLIEKDGYKNIDKKSMSILSSGSATPPQQTTPQQPDTMKEILRNRAMILGLQAFHGKDLPEDFDDLVERKLKYLTNEAR